MTTGHGTVIKQTAWCVVWEKMCIFLYDYRPWDCVIKQTALCVVSEKKFVCTYDGCSYSAIQKSRLQEHIKRMHTEKVSGKQLTYLTHIHHIVYR